MPDVIFNGLPAKDAIAQLEERSKRLITTERWDDMRGEAHAKAFTIAGGKKAALLADMYASIEDNLKTGKTLSDFRKDFDTIVQDHGWQYKGNRSWRTRVIYETNMRTAYAAGHWKRIQATKKHLPYLVYMTVGDSRVRDAHKPWRYICLPVDHPWWNTHYPPNDWGCRCYVMQANDAMLKRMGIAVTEIAPPLNPTERINSTTGEVYGDVPQGIGIGWDYNVGKAWLGPEIAYGKHLSQIKPELAEALLNKARNKQYIRVLNRNWKRWIEDIELNGTQNNRFVVGFLPGEVIASLHTQNIALHTAAIEVIDRDLKHLKGGHKGEEKRITEGIFNNLPEQLHNAEAVYKHSNGSIVFVFSEQIGSKKGRAAIKLNMSKKNAVLNSIRSLGVIDINNLKQKEYTLIAGKKM